MDELITNRGMSIAEARRRAKSQLGLEEWQIRAASQLVRDGSLSGGIQQGVQAHLPGNHLPPTW
jgi:ABC-type sugar transport system ATPase subunit